MCLRKFKLFLWNQRLSRTGIRWRVASFLHWIKKPFYTKKRTYYLAIVAIIKDEGPYLKEWIDYHLAAGFEHFYLYDNDSSDQTKTVLDPYIAKGLVTYRFFPGRGLQLSAYQDACEKYWREASLMAFIDADEFFCPSEGCLNEKVPSLVSRLLGKRASGLAVQWMHFGNSFHLKTAPGPVIERFQYRAKGPSHPVKTIVKPLDVYRWESPHYPWLFHGKYKIDCGGKRVPGHEIANPSLSWPLRLNHYATKSTEEWIIRKQKGMADSSSPPPKASDLSWETFNRINTNEVFDDSAARYYLIAQND